MRNANIAFYGQCPKCSDRPPPLRVSWMRFLFARKVIYVKINIIIFPKKQKYWSKWILKDHLPQEAEFS